MRSPRFLAGMSLVLATIAVALAIAAVLIALNAPYGDDDAEVAMVEPNAYTVSMVDEAVRYYQAHGWAETAEYYLSPRSVDGTWHVFMVNPEDRFVASQDQSAARPQHPEPGKRLQGQQLGRHRNPRKRAMGALACLAPGHRVAHGQPHVGRAPRRLRVRLRLVRVGGCGAALSASTPSPSTKAWTTTSCSA